MEQSTNQFQHIFDRLADGPLAQLENKRQVFVASFKKTLWIVVPIFVLLTVMAILSQLFFIIIIALAISVFVLIYKHNRFFKGFRAEYKATVIPSLVAVVDERLSYHPELQLINEYNHSGIFNRDYDRFKAEDTVKGTIDKTDISFGEIHTEYKTTSTDSKGNRKTEWHTIFCGVFFVADFHKDFKGETYIDQDTLERSLGSFGRKLQSWNFSRSGKLIRMENPEFEKNFAVYATDEQEGRYLLTPAFMDRLLRFKEKSGANFSVALKSSNIYLAYSIRQDLFEPKTFKSLMQPDDAKFLVDLISLFRGLVDDLQLNTRLWTKE